MPFNANDPSFGPFRGSVIKEESQPDGIEQLAAANLYVLSGGVTSPLDSVQTLILKTLTWLQPFLYLWKFQWTLMLMVN